MGSRSKLRETVVEHSEGKEWESAKTEWQVIDLETCSGDGECCCGQTNLVYLYTIKNKTNGNILKPIGSSCIQYFESDRMTEDIKILDTESEKVGYGKYEELTFKEIYDRHLDYIIWLEENYTGGKSKRKANKFFRLITYYQKRQDMWKLSHTPN